MKPVRKWVERSCRSARRAVFTVELILTLPIVLLLLLALIEFSLLAHGHQKLVVAARDGARVASLSGASEGQVKWAVLRHLRGPMAEQAEIRVRLAERSGEPVTVQVAVPMKAAAPDLLRIVGLGLADRCLVAATTMAKE